MAAGNTPRNASRAFEPFRGNGARPLSFCPPHNAEKAQPPYTGLGLFCVVSGQACAPPSVNAAGHSGSESVHGAGLAQRLGHMGVDKAG